MRRFFKITLLFLFICISTVALYGALGYFDALGDSAALRQRANTILSENRGGASLGADRYRQILLVQDPNFEHHNGVDVTTPGAGLTTISQSLAKRVGFKQFKPGIRKIRQTGYAFGLEQELSKKQIMALWLDTLEMGQGPDGWLTGFHHASEIVYGLQPAELDDDQFLTLVAVIIAPSRYNLHAQDAALKQRVERISRLVAGSCSALSNSDVWLEGCRE
ncbi:Transglycosylase [Cohaesibacter sp. ES.047]|uniref:transglycosylase domain-containing protein n=1 Tax=Cohaesibacter sp. ES.047 TaxID=1798205 RepID=UPI000BB9BD22|nr:transglycosylase domain-containing protein [Cohaesibacter sp. ES.047]SNY93129.1 Transglycosylase [Cohaesibacter sp. ES.047]